MADASAAPAVPKLPVEHIAEETAVDPDNLSITQGVTGAGAGAGAGDGAAAGEAAGETTSKTKSVVMSPAEAIADFMEEAREAKATGNKLFGEGQWAKAMTEYHRACSNLATMASEFPHIPSSIAAEARTLETTSLLNLAQAQLNSDMPDLACKSATLVVQADPTNVKGWFRLSTAFQRLKSYDGALQAIQRAYKLDPKNKAVRKELKRMMAATKKDRQRQAAFVKGAFSKYGEALEKEAADAEAAAASKATAEDAGTGAGSGAGAGAGEGAGEGDGAGVEETKAGQAATDKAATAATAAKKSGSGSDSDTEDSDSEDEDEEDEDEEERVPYSDDEAFRRGLKLGLDKQKVAEMVMAGQGPLLMAGFKSEEQYREEVARRGASV